MTYGSVFEVPFHQNRGRGGGQLPQPRKYEVGQHLVLPPISPFLDFDTDRNGL